MIEQRFIDMMAQNLVEEPEPIDEVQLAESKNMSYPNEVMSDTGGGAMVGYRLNMPKRLATDEDRAKQSTLIANTLAGQTRGMVQGFGGIGGDLETVGRLALNVLGFNVGPDAKLITSKDIADRLESLGVSQENISGLIDKAMPSQAGSATAEEKARAFGGGETLGEVTAPGGQIALGAKVAKPVIGATKKIIEAGKDLPVGMSIKGVDESLDPLGFYSAASKAVDNIAQEKGTGAQFLAQIEKTPGVKREELLWTGLDDYLKGKKSVTKAEVQEFLNANRVEVQEVQLGDLKFNTQSEYALPEVVDLLKKEQGSSYENMRLVLENDYNAYQALTKKFPNLEDTDNWSDRVLSELIDTNSGAARFEKFTLPGGENYREIYLTLPSKMNEDQIAQEMYGAPFDKLMGRARADVVNKVRENQYIVPRAHSASPEADVNRLAQIRVNDRIDADGKKVLFVEEIQSDWHQAGRKMGYADPKAIKEKDNLLNEMNDLTRKKLSLRKDYDSSQKAGDIDKQNELSKQMAEIENQQSNIRESIDKISNVPDAPFKTSWHELALKRAIQLASEGGYDRIAFTTGKTQAERYDLSKEIQDITITRGKFDFAIQATDKNGKPAIYKTIPDLRNLDELVGKDLAEKVKDDFANKSGNEHNYSGLDLQVGGEGMAGFYDNILPKYLDKYGKKWDAKTGMTSIKADGSDAPVHYMDITPKMKESVLTKGQPLFQMAPAIPAGVAAGQQEDNK